ncbi:MAG: quinol dehydrogenase ferredoxin subunit NapH [Sutterellaceae bacterium]|nr:quinol dehydrogenase ferredoxin subunit NapH [Sutterellaceae bacterium]
MSTQNEFATRKSGRAPKSETPNRKRLLMVNIVRRVLQLTVLTLFVGTARLGWTLLGAPLLSGDFSASLMAGLVPLTDPFATLQKLVAGHAPELTMITGALIVLALYIILGGRVFCGWMCPMNMVTDSAAWLREKAGLRADMVRIHRHTRYALCVASLVASVITGAAAFEWVSPQALLWREAVWGVGLGFISAVLGIFTFDFLVVPRGWCGHLCPLGAFWSVVGKVGVLKPVFDDSRCTRCGLCLKPCPEPHVLNFQRTAQIGFIASGECTGCGRCAAVCPENAIRFAPRFSAKAAPKENN